LQASSNVLKSIGYTRYGDSSDIYEVKLHLVNDIMQVVKRI